MAEATGRGKTKGNAKQRSFFALRERQAKEEARPKQQTADALMAEQRRKTDRAEDAQIRREEQRRAEFRKTQQQQAQARRKAADSRDEYNRKAQDRRAADAVRAESLRRAQAIQYAQRKEQQRKADLTAEERRTAARDLRHERQAIRDVRQTERQARDAMLFRQRQETAELRTRHKTERRGIDAEIEGHELSYLDMIKRVDFKERRTLADFDTKRRTVRGRLDELRRGTGAVDEERRNLQVAFDIQRAAIGHKMETLKDKLLQQEFFRPIEQALERKAMMESHSQQRDAQQQRHDQARPEAVASRKLVHARAYEREQQQRQEMKHEHAAGLTHEFSRRSP